MKTTKRHAKKNDPSKTKGKPAADKELSEEQLEHVAGGAVDIFVKYTGVAGEVAQSPEYKITAKI